MCQPELNPVLAFMFFSIVVICLAIPLLGLVIEMIDAVRDKQNYPSHYADG